MTAFAEINSTRVIYPGDSSEGGRLATDVWEQERYRRVLATPDGLALVKVAKESMGPSISSSPSTPP